MDERTYYFFRNLSWPEAWIPEGYELKEKSDHKKKRLEMELEQEKTNIESYKRYLSESEEKVKKLKDELKDLD